MFLQLKLGSLGWDPVPFPHARSKILEEDSLSLCCKAQLLLANKYTSYPLWLVSAGDFLKLNLDLVWYLSVGEINSTETPEVNHSLAAQARVASWASLVSSLLVWPHYCLVTL